MVFRRRRRRHRVLETSSNAMFRALCEAGLSEQAKRLRIFQCWTEAVGTEIAARTEPQIFRRGTLIVRAASPTWQNELMFLKTNLMARLNELLGSKMVLELKVVSGVLTPQENIPHPAAPRRAPGPHHIRAAQALTENMQDDDIRAAFVRLIAKDQQARQALDEAPDKSPRPDP